MIVTYPLNVLLHIFSAFFLHLSSNMGVNFQCKVGSRMPQVVLYSFHIGAAAQCHIRICVAKVVEPSLWSTNFLCDALEAVINGSIHDRM